MNRRKGVDPKSMMFDGRFPERLLGSIYLFTSGALFILILDFVGRL